MAILEWNSDRWNSGVRSAFWVIGVVLGMVVTYTTRSHITGDAISYIEIGEAFFQGYWWGIVNLTWSPAYAVMIGLGQAVLNTNPLNEIPLLKAVNFLIFLGAMASCDFLLSMVKRQYAGLVALGRRPIPFAGIAGITYSLFLFITIDWIRLATISPDMLIMCFFLTSTAIVVWIRESCEFFGKFWLLGLALGAGYLTRTYFLPMSLVFFFTSSLACRSLRQAVPRVLFGMLVTAIIAAPLIYCLSLKAGRFSYGEAGTFNYGKKMGRKGEAVHPPIIVSQKPEVEVYTNNPFRNVTDPYHYDTAFWHLGETPVFVLERQLEIFLGCLYVVGTDSPWLFVGMFVWCLFHVASGSIKIGRLSPVPLWGLLVIPALAGFGLFSLVQIDMRYVAPFPITAFLGLLLIPRLEDGRTRTQSISLALTLGLLCTIVGLTVNSVVDQSLRCLRSTAGKPSRQSEFEAMIKIKDFLHSHGVKEGSSVGLVGLPQWYWARMAGVKIMGRITGKSGQEKEFFVLTPKQRVHAIRWLEFYGIRAIIGSGPGFGDLVHEGWSPIPGAPGYCVYLTTPAEKSGFSRDRIPPSDK